MHMSTDALHGFIPEMTVADRLALARRVVGIDQSALAAQTGIARRTLFNYEDRDYPGRRNPIYLRAIAHALGCDTEWLLTGERPHPQGGGEIGNTNGRDTYRYDADRVAYPPQPSRFALAA